LGVEQDVSLPGYEDNPYRYMSKAALFVLSSAWEGFGNVLVEALAAGVPVLAADCKDGPREILEAVGQGRLVQVGDAEAMAVGILASLDEKPEPASASALRVFTLNHAVDEYAALLQTILTGRDRGKSVML
jgi:glycosyltransferase involved in cell wall biosynthesis